MHKRLVNIDIFYFFHFATKCDFCVSFSSLRANPIPNLRSISSLRNWIDLKILGYFRHVGLLFLSILRSEKVFYRDFDQGERYYDVSILIIYSFPNLEYCVEKCQHEWCRRNTVGFSWSLCSNTKTTIHTRKAVLTILYTVRIFWELHWITWITLNFVLSVWVIGIAIWWWLPWVRPTLNSQSKHSTFTMRWIICVFILYLAMQIKMAVGIRKKHFEYVKHWNI